MNFYRFLIPRLNGKDIEKDFESHLRLVKKGIGGFIVFGGNLKIVRAGIKELQKASKQTLIIASDLEQGLGQQIEGGTLFPPAMAVAEAIKDSSKFKVQSSKFKLLQKVFKAIAIESRYAGINTIFAPVLDINTNPRNPIIATRAFGEDSETVSFFGNEMIRIFQSNGITACGKHFPGHGDTEIDSHIKLPVIRKSLKSLEKNELVPFRNAVKAGVKMIMLAHLKVPALDPSGIPVSLSQKAVRYLRDKMKFKGITITDALNMGGIGKYSEEEASLMALRAGVDLLLHTTDPDRVVSYLERSSLEKLSVISYQLSVRGSRFTVPVPLFEEHKQLSEKITSMAIKVKGQLRPLRNPLLIILNDDIEDKGGLLCHELKIKYQNMKCFVFKAGEDIEIDGNKDREVIVAIFSKVRAWKGGSSSWLFESLKKIEGKSGIFISFGSPYILDRIGDCPGFTDRAKRSRRIGTVPAVKIYAYWDSEAAQKAVAELF